MHFNDLLNLVPKLVKEKLPGTDSHIKMEPPERRKLIQETDFSVVIPKRSAVLLLLYPKNEIVHVVLIMRNSYTGVHSAQIGLPGGKFEVGDGSLKQTALRETFEEIGVENASVTIFKELTELYIPPSNFMVQPFVGFCNHEINFVPNPEEVSEIIEIPLHEILDDNSLIDIELETSYMKNILVPTFKIDDRIIWGATAMMLSELKDLFKKLC